MSDGEAEAGVSNHVEGVVSPSLAPSDASDYNEANGLLSRADQVRITCSGACTRALCTCTRIVIARASCHVSSTCCGIGRWCDVAEWFAAH